MKLGKIKSLALGVVIAAMALTQYSCEADWLKEYEPTTLKQPSTATASVNTIKDSTAMLNYSLSTVGRIYIAVVPGTNESALPATSTMLTLKTPKAVFSKQVVFNDAAALSGSVKITGLVQNTSYKVYILPVNEDGVQGEIATTDAFTTSDSFVPTLSLSSGINPAISTSAAQATDFKAVLTFNEPVVLAETFTITYGYRNAVTGVITVVSVPKDSIKIASNKVTISQPQVALNGQYVFLSIGAGSILDRAGNAYAGVPSTLSGSTLTGIYWRIKYEVITPKVITTAKVISNFTTKIVLDYPTMKMRFPSVGYSQSKIVLRYTSFGGIRTEIEVPQSYVAIVQDTLVQISLPKVPMLGSISLMMAEGALTNSYGSPSAAIAFDKNVWITANRDLLIGNYKLKCTSTFGDNPATYTFNVSVVANPANPDGVLITGLEGSTLPVEGVFDNAAGMLTIAQDQTLGDLLGDGSAILLYSNKSESGDIEAFVQPNGTILMDWASYVSGGVDDGNYYDRYYGAVWTKVVTSYKDNSTITKPFIVKTRVK